MELWECGFYQHVNAKFVFFSFADEVPFRKARQNDNNEPPHLDLHCLLFVLYSLNSQYDKAWT